MTHPLLSILLTASGACPQEAPPAPLFHEERLVGVTTTSGSRAKDYIIDVNGGGLAAADFDGDGADDLVVVDGSTLERVQAGRPGHPARMFLNAGGELRPAPEAWNLAPGRWGTGAAAGDVDGDGHVDLVVLNWGADQLFRNVGGEGFREDREAGLVGLRWGTSGAFLDVDRDGFLDLVVVNYLAFDTSRIASRTDGACRWKGHAVMCGPEGLTPVHDQLYRNVDGRAFEDVSRASGFRPERAGFGLGVMTADLDRDGDTDLYVANDSTPNHVWENRTSAEGWAFTERGLRAGLALDAGGKEQAGMGIACGDWNGDGTEDLFVTNFSGESNALYLSLVRRDGGDARTAFPRWRERAAPSGLGGPSRTLLGWGAVAADLDLDGDLDLATFNGHVYPQADAPGTDTSYAQPDLLYRNEPNAGGRLFFRPEVLSDAPPVVSRAALPVDLDGDGRLDLVALELDGGVRLLRNRAPVAEGWRGLRVRLRGRGANVHALGARVVLEQGDTRVEREIRTAGGFQTAVPPEAHFALGPGAARVRVTWPSGATSVHPVEGKGHVLSLEEPAR